MPLCLPAHTHTHAHAHTPPLTPPPCQSYAGGLSGPIAMASLSNGSLLVLEHGGKRFTLLTAKTKSKGKAAPEPTPQSDTSL
jgi:hypothetical protein